MDRGAIIQRFRQENPSITANVASDAVLQSWCEIGNLEVATRARLIRGETTFSSSIDEDTYNLTALIPSFYDIDELPGGGVVYNNKRIELESVASLDAKRSGWRTQSSGTPIDYYRRNQFLVFGRDPSSVEDVLVYSVLKPDTLDDDSKTPFNQLEHLEPFHYSLVLYLEMRVYGNKVIRPTSEMTAKQEYETYIDWLKKEVYRGIYQDIIMRPPVNYRGHGRRKGTRTRR